MDKQPDKVMIRVRELLETSGMTLDEIGRRMGYGKSPRKSAWQFLHGTNDPRLSMLRKFAEAVGISVAELLIDEKKKDRSK